MGSGSDLAEIEARLSAILEPYRSLLEPATIYGLPTLRRRGAKAHEWFAFVKRATRHVSFFLMPIVTWPELLDGCSPALVRAHKGKSAFNFTSLDEAVAADLEALVARSYERYMAA
jgi:hypothetical protein